MRHTSLTGWVAIVLALVGCGRATTAKAIENHVTTAPGSSAPIALALTGRYDSVDAYCHEIEAASAGDDDYVDCSPHDSDHGEAGPFDAVMLMSVSKPDDHRSIGCAFLVRRGDWWYATPVSADVCVESGYIEIGALAVAPLADGHGVALSVDVSWHTNDYSDEAGYTLTALCGVAADRPRCTPIFVSACERLAPAGGCSDQGYQVTWSVEAGRVTFAAQPAPTDGASDVRALVGTHVLGF